MTSPKFSAELEAVIDQEHASVRDVIDSCPSIAGQLSDPSNAPAMFGRLIVIDCLCFAHDPLRMMYRLAAWERLTREHGG